MFDIITIESITIDTEIQKSQKSEYVSLDLETKI